MTMTRKHHEALAKVLRENEDRLDITDALIEVLKADNPRFDPQRFLGAVWGCQICGKPWGH